MCVASRLRVLVVDGRRVLLKLCFQVFIVLSPADEAGTCRVYEGAWGGVALWVSRIRVSGRRLRPNLSRHSNSLVAVMFESFGSQSEVDYSSHCIHVRCPVVVIRGRFASEQTRKIVFASVNAQDFPLLTPPSTAKDKMVSRLDCLTTFAKVRLRCFDVVQISVQWGHACAELRENARLSLAEVVVYAPSVVAGPGSVDSAYGSPNGRRHLLIRLPQAFLSPLNRTSGQPGSVFDHSSLVRGSLR
jgi:hypothetical protein